MGQLAQVIEIASQVASSVSAVRTVASVFKKAPKPSAPPQFDAADPSVSGPSVQSRYREGLSGYFKALASASPSRAKKLQDSGVLKTRYDAYKAGEK